MTGPLPFSGPLGPSATFVFTPSPAGWIQLVATPASPVARSLLRRAEMVKAAAAAQIPLGKPNRNPRARVVEHPHLRDTLYVRPTYFPAAPPVVRVGSEAPYALAHHEGTPPHQIVPRVAKVLAFWPDGAPGVVFARRVQHPGNRPNRYLTDSLHLAVQ